MLHNKKKEGNNPENKMKYYERVKLLTTKYNFEVADTQMLLQHFNDWESEAKKLVEQNLVLPAYDAVMKCSHLFNLLDARGVISKDERINYINRVRTMAAGVAKLYVEQRAELGFPLCK